MPEYNHLIDQIRTYKLEINNLRTKCTNFQNQLLSYQNNKQILSKTIQSLKQTIQKLTIKNNKLQSQKQQLINQYNQNIQQIKTEINRKQSQINKYQFSEDNININLIRKQIQYQLEEQYHQKINQKDQKIKQLNICLEKYKNQQKLKEDKMGYRIKYLEKQLEDLKDKYLKDIQQYTYKIYQGNQSNKIDDQSILKKYKRQIDELRKVIEFKNQEINQITNQRSIIQNQYHRYINNNNNQVENALNEAKIHRLQAQRLSQLSNSNPVEKENIMLRERQRQIKRLKNQLENLHQQLLNKEQKIQNLSIKNAEYIGQIKKIKQQHQRNIQQKVKQIKYQKECFKKQLELVRQNYQTLKIQKNDLLLKIHKQETGKKSSILRNTPIQLNHNIPTKDQEKQRQLYNQIEQERGKGKQIAINYIQLKKKYQKLKKKLELANSKIVQLLKNKVQMRSPKASQKKIVFFNQPLNSEHLHTINTSPGNFYPMQEINRQQEQLTRQSSYNGDFANALNRSHRKFLSPQNIHLAQINQPNNQQRNRTVSSGSKQYYQKSLKIRRIHKYKQLQCTNHQNEHTH